MDKPFIEILTPLGSELIKPEEIISLRSNDKSICIHLENQTEKEINFSIGKAEKLLEQEFFVRCHRCHIVNVLKIKGWTRKHSNIHLINGESIPVSKSYRKQFEQTLAKFCTQIGNKNHDN